MTIPPSEQLGNIHLVVSLLLDKLGDRAIDEFFFSASDSEFSQILSTTWEQLERYGWITKAEPLEQFSFTGHGWIKSAQMAGRLEDLQRQAEPLFAAMKSYVDGRPDKPALVPLRILAERARLSEGFVFNMIDSHVLESTSGRTGADWYKGSGRIVKIPVGFNTQPINIEAILTGNAAHRIEELEEELAFTRDELSQYRCPTCGVPLSSSGSIDYDEDNSGYVETFECGYTTDGYTERPCPSSPKFPKLEDFEFVFKEEKSLSGTTWFCYPRGKTKEAKSLPLRSGYGNTQEEAKQTLVQLYNFMAKPWKGRGFLLSR